MRRKSVPALRMAKKSGTAIAGLLVCSASCEYTTHAAIGATRRVRMVQLPFVLEWEGGELALHSSPPGSAPE